MTNENGAVAAPVEQPVRPLVARLRDAAPQAGHYGAWSGGVLLEQAADEIQQLARDNMTLFAEIKTLKGLLQEALEISDNWPGIAYTADLIERCKKAMPGWALTHE